ncbi:cobalamin biosynthesis protein CbiA [Desulfonema magnum]|uniref:P-loop containing n=1 Tax=Desulfonema magnum TaxID=45655 RepID=A0A975GQE0_9BACT|nr:cobalamin biosynthesis protein CbiA [Desulfonema magnum]QTA89805.1 p-loop containing [Desulfonema magnum]
MEIDLHGIVVIVGNYGSGKTEVSINLAVNQKRAGMDVRIADLDLVNPYFRTREARNPLSTLGIDMVLPPEKYMQADLPILTPAIAGMIRQPTEMTLLDVGGDDVGATVLASLAEPLRGKNIRMLQVVNPFRPFTDTVQGCLKIRDEIEKASKMTINGIIGNTNLIDETTMTDIYEGYDFVHALSEASGLPLEFVTITTELFPEADMKRFSCPVLPIERQLVPPWKKAANLGPALLKPAYNNI